MVSRLCVISRGFSRRQGERRTPCIDCTSQASLLSERLRGFPGYLMGPVLRISQSVFSDASVCGSAACTCYGTSSHKGSRWLVYYECGPGFDAHYRWKLRKKGLCTLVLIDFLISTYLSKHSCSGSIFTLLLGHNLNSKYPL